MTIRTQEELKGRVARCAQSALQKAIEVARAGRPLNVIGRAVQMEVERRGFSVIPGVGGHGSADPFTKTRSCTIAT